jgi:hypothetical protein
VTAVERAVDEMMIGTPEEPRTPSNDEPRVLRQVPRRDETTMTTATTTIVGCLSR